MGQGKNKIQHLFTVCESGLSTKSHILKGPLLFHPQEWLQWTLEDESTQPVALVTTSLYTAR